MTDPQRPGADDEKSECPICGNHKMLWAEHCPECTDDERLAKLLRRLREPSRPMDWFWFALNGIEALDLLRAELSRLRSPSADSGHNEPCIMCGELCNGMHGNPSLWPVRLDNEGWRHVGCVNKALRGLRSPSADMDMVERARALEYPVKDYLDGYEFRGDYDHAPTDDERVLLDDAIAGLLGDDAFCNVTATFAATVAHKARQQQDDEIRRLRLALDVAQDWFTSHQYSGDGLTVVQRLREVSNPEEIAKARAAEQRVWHDTTNAARNEARQQALEEAARRIESHWEAENGKVQLYVAELALSDVQETIRSLMAESPAESDPADVWRPIETAPKDGTRVLLAPIGRTVAAGNWNEDKYSAKPRPYWTNDYDSMVTMARRHQPTHWLPLPAPPSTPERGKDHSND